MTLNETRYIFPFYAEKERKLDDKDIAQTSLVVGKDIAQASLVVGGSPKQGEIYRHYKGGLYTVVAKAIKEDTLEPMVVYQSNAKGTTWIRTLEDWSQEVRVEGIGLVKRFTRETD